MEEGRDKKILTLQGGMFFLNLVAVCLINGFVWKTTSLICSRYDARDFLDQIQKLPHTPRTQLVICVLMMQILFITFLIRNFLAHRQNVVVLTMILDAAAILVMIVTMDFNYNGVLLLLFANMIYYVRSGKSRLGMAILAILGYLVADQELLTVYFPLYKISSYIQYYSASTQQYLVSIYNILISLNMILFIIYCIYVINAQRDTIEKVNFLYHELQSANEQLQEYADMTERMTQTRERNRLAREIHDTLGHTLTGISVGLDACLATLDVAPEQTKQQLEMLSKVSREGINDIRRSVNELRPDALERLSLEVAVRKMITDMSRMSDVQIYFQSSEKHLRFDEDEESAIYRVIQESITNAIRHGKAGQIWITLERKDGELILVIRDDGIGCKDMVAGFGTKHIRERIEMLRGTVSFDGSQGFTVTARIPIRWGDKYD